LADAAAVVEAVAAVAQEGERGGRKELERKASARYGECKESCGSASIGCITAFTTATATRN